MSTLEWFQLAIGSGSFISLAVLTWGSLGTRGGIAAYSLCRSDRLAVGGHNSIDIPRVAAA